jgi:RNA polymerase sigma-70 factor (ECF subfamily)
MTVTQGALQARLARDLDRHFPELVTEMQGMVYNGARRWLPGRQDAEDVTQEAFVRAYQALQGYPAQRIADLRIRPWLFTIAINLCRNHARTRARRPQQAPLDASPELPSQTRVEHDAVDAVVVDEWRERLAQLPNRQRDAIVLRHVVDLSYGEIGEVLGCPAGTAKSDVSRGLQRLRTLLATEEQT